MHPLNEMSCKSDPDFQDSFVEPLVFTCERWGGAAVTRPAIWVPGTVADIMRLDVSLAVEEAGSGNRKRERENRWLQFLGGGGGYRGGGGDTEPKGGSPRSLIKSELWMPSDASLGCHFSRFT